MAAMIHAESRNPYHCFMVDGRPVWAWRSQVQYINIHCKVYELLVSPTKLNYTETHISWFLTCRVVWKPSFGTLNAPSELQFGDIIPSTRAIGLYSIQPIEHTSTATTKQRSSQTVKNASMVINNVKGRKRKQKKGNNFWWVLFFLLERKCGIVSFMKDNLR